MAQFWLRQQAVLGSFMVKFPNPKSKFQNRSCRKSPELPHYARLPVPEHDLRSGGITFPRHPSRMRSLLVSLLFLGLCGSTSGCAFSRPLVAGNPIFISAGNEDAVWERTVDVLHDYFDIARENRIVGSQPGVIETRFRVGASLLEPWHRDSHGLDNRVESTLQSIRRMARVSVTPAQGGYLIGVEVFKEIEDLPGVANNTAGGATFHQADPLRRDLDLVTGQSSPSGWVPRGRDTILENEMLRRMQLAYTQ
jgi:hypothetical protein